MPAWAYTPGHPNRKRIGVMIGTHVNEIKTVLYDVTGERTVTPSFFQLPDDSCAEILHDPVAAHAFPASPFVHSERTELDLMTEYPQRLDLIADLLTDSVERIETVEYEEQDFHDGLPLRLNLVKISYSPLTCRYTNKVNKKTAPFARMPTSSGESFVRAVVAPSNSTSIPLTASGETSCRQNPDRRLFANVTRYIIQ